MIKGIIFDLGHTLFRFTSDWETVSQTGAEAMAAWYKKKRIKLDVPAFVDAFLSARTAGWETATQTQAEVTAQQSLHKALEKVGAPPAAKSPAMLQSALKICFESEEAVWQLYPDALSTLKQLNQADYQLGLFSNATDDAFIQRLINKSGLRPWLSPTFSSAAWGWRKPRPEPFALIARRWSLHPSQVAMVGDTLAADILGAQNAGMTAILATMDEHPTNITNRHIKPDQTIACLADLLVQIKP